MRSSFIRIVAAAGNLEIGLSSAHRISRLSPAACRLHERITITHQPSYCYGYLEFFPPNPDWRLTQFIVFVIDGPTAKWSSSIGFKQNITCTYCFIMCWHGVLNKTKTTDPWCISCSRLTSCTPSRPIFHRPTGQYPIHRINRADPMKMTPEKMILQWRWHRKKWFYGAIYARNPAISPRHSWLKQTLLFNFEHNTNNTRNPIIFDG